MSATHRLTLTPLGIGLLMLTLCLCGVRPARSQSTTPPPRFAVLDIVGPDASGTVPIPYTNALNKKGHVVGNDPGFYIPGGPISGNRAFLWTLERGVQFLGQLQPGLDSMTGPMGWNSLGSIGLGLNNSDAVVGWSAQSFATFDSAAGGWDWDFSVWGRYPYANNRPFLWDSANGMRVVGIPTPDAGQQGQANAINDNGQVVGVWGPSVLQNSAGTGSSGEFFFDGTTTQDLGALTGGMYPAAINNNGWVAGFRGTQAVVWDGSSVTVLPGLGGSSGDQATALNDNGQIVGWVGTSDVNVNGYERQQAFVWGPGNGSQWLGPPPLPSGEVPDQWNTAAVGINMKGEVIGAASPFDPSLTDIEEDVYWSPSGDAYFIRDLMPAGWSSVYVGGINDDGQISCQALNGNDGTYHFLLLTPLANTVQAPAAGETLTVAPSPSTMLTVSSGFVNAATGQPVAQTTVTATQQSGTPPNLPGVYLPVAGGYYQVSLDPGVTLPSGATALVCIAYDPAIVTDPSSLVLMHQKADGTWEQLPTTVNTDSHLVWGTTTGFSPFTVAQKVPDTTPPVITTPGNISATATSTAGAVVNFTATAVDNVDGPVPVTYSQNPGTTFAPGTTTVTVSAHDAAANKATPPSM